MSRFKFVFWPLVAVACITLALVFVLPLPGATATGNLDALDKGPAIGAPIPHSLKTVDQYNENQDFESLRRKRGLILLFSRSFDW